MNNVICSPLKALRNFPIVTNKVYLAINLCLIVSMTKQLGKLTEIGLGIIPMPGHTRTFQLLIRHIGESRTKYEEDRIMAREVTFLKQNLMAPEVSVRQQMEFIIRMMYLEMLGEVVCLLASLFACLFIYLLVCYILCRSRCLVRLHPRS